MLDSRNLRAFISHCPKDLLVARELYLALDKVDWIDLWLIESNLQISQNWELEIQHAVAGADVVIVLFAKNSMKRATYFYPDPALVLEILGPQPKNTVVILVRLDNSSIPANLQAWEVIHYFPKSQRRLVHTHLLEKLEVYAKANGFSMTKQTQDLGSGKGFQWSPSYWKGKGDIFAEGTTDDDDIPKKPKPPSSRLKKRIFTGIGNLVFYSLIVAVLLGVAILGLALNYFARGEAPNPVAVPIIAKVLTFVPFPTPTLGVGSTRISPKDGMRMVYVPRGEFLMGSNVGSEDERPVHKVYLDAFWIDQYEATNGMYAKCVEAKVCSVPIPYEMFLPSFDSNQGFFRYLADHSKFFHQLTTNREFFSQPATSILWENANAYCHWVGR